MSQPPVPEGAGGFVFTQFVLKQKDKACCCDGAKPKV